MHLSSVIELWLEVLFWDQFLFLIIYNPWLYQGEKDGLAKTG